MIDTNERELEKMALTTIYPTGQVPPDSIKVIASQKSEHEFVIDVIRM